MADQLDLFAGTPEWEQSLATATVIDVDDFVAAHDDPEWLAFCRKADAYFAEHRA